MCKVLKVNRSLYYHWIKTGCIIKKVDKKLNQVIEIIFVQGRDNYGTRRIRDKLKDIYGLIISRKRILNIMKVLKLKVKMKRSCKNTTDSNHNLPIAPNISNRDFNASRTDEKICRRYYLHSKKEIFEYTEFYYNRHSNHSYLGNLSPIKFEEKQKVLRNEMVA